VSAERLILLQKQGKSMMVKERLHKVADFKRLKIGFFSHTSRQSPDSSNNQVTWVILRGLQAFGLKRVIGNLR